MGPKTSDESTIEVIKLLLVANNDKQPELVHFMVVGATVNPIMESAQVEEALKVLNSSLSQIKWRLKSSSKLRLEIGLFSPL